MKKGIRNNFSKFKFYIILLIIILAFFIGLTFYFGFKLTGHTVDSTYVYGDLRNGLIGYWPFDSDAKDYSGNGYDGKIYGGVASVNGKISGAYNFDGIDDVIQLANLTTDPYSYNPTTTSMWVNPLAQTTKTRYLLSHPGSENNNNSLYIWQQATNRYAFYLGNSTNTKYLSTTAPTGQWVNIVIIRDPITNWSQGYFNGELVVNYSTSISSKTSRLNLFIGGFSTSNRSDFFNGAIDEVSIWNRALSTSEIQQIYNSGNGIALGQKTSGTGGGSGSNLTVNNIFNPSSVSVYYSKFNSTSNSFSLPNFIFDGVNVDYAAAANNLTASKWCQIVGPSVGKNFVSGSVGLSPTSEIGDSIGWTGSQWMVMKSDRLRYYYCIEGTSAVCIPLWSNCSVSCGNGTQSDGCGNIQVCIMPACTNQTNVTNINATCLDSDGGLNYYVRGTISFGTTTDLDMCDEDGKTLFEGFCRAGVAFDFAPYVCPEGCANGVCINKTNFVTTGGSGNNSNNSGSCRGCIVPTNFGSKEYNGKCIASGARFWNDNNNSFYCAINGSIGAQKTEIAAKCQNDFECDSNLCSSGKCVDFNGIVEQLTGFRGFVTKLLCRLTYFFSSADYNKCLVGSIGEYNATNYRPSAGNGGSCSENWSCGEWGKCNVGTRSRSCFDMNGCGTVFNKPAVTETCTVCNEDWNCSSWSACSNGQQIRTCTDLRNCGTTFDRPVLTLYCNQNISGGSSGCSAWGKCMGPACYLKNITDGNASAGKFVVCPQGNQSRTCFDSNGNPSTETQSCKVCQEGWNCGNWVCDSTGSTMKRTCTYWNMCNYPSLPNRTESAMCNYSLAKRYLGSVCTSNAECSNVVCPSNNCMFAGCYSQLDATNRIMPTLPKICAECQSDLDCRSKYCTSDVSSDVGSCAYKVRCDQNICKIPPCVTSSDCPPTYFCDVNTKQCKPNYYLPTSPAGFICTISSDCAKMPCTTCRGGMLGCFASRDANNLLVPNEPKSCFECEDGSQCKSGICRGNICI